MRSGFSKPLLIFLFSFMLFISIFLVNISTVYRYKSKRGDNPSKTWQREFEIIMIIAKSYRSQIKRGNKLLFDHQHIYLNDRQATTRMQDNQPIRHTKPAEHRSIRNPTNIQQQSIRNKNAPTFTPEWKSDQPSPNSRYLNYSDWEMEKYCWRSKCDRSNK